MSFIDLHQDLLSHINRRDLFPADQWQTNFELIAQNKFNLVCATAFPVPSGENFFDPISNRMIEDEFLQYRKKATEPGWTLIQTATDVDRVVAPGGPIGLLLHIEGLNVIDDDSWDRLEHWYNIGWRSLGIVWNLTNPLGGGTTDPIQGLTPLGAKLIEWCTEKRMVIDFAHMNEPTFWDCAKMGDRPIYVSHGNCRALCDHVRNYTDEQLRAIAHSGGVIGVFCAKTYVTGKDKPGTIEHLLQHIRHILKVIGDDHIAFGTDFGGIVTGFLKDLESISALPRLLEVMRRAGIKEDTIEKICYKNAKRILKQHLL